MQGPSGLLLWLRASHPAEVALELALVAGHALAAEHIAMLGWRSR